MGSVDWLRVQRTGFPVPGEAPLIDLTAELTEMLGAADPRLREDLAVATLRTWIRRGVYDDLLSGLGDGMASGLSCGLGESGTGTVFRRGCSAQVLETCIARDIAERRVPQAKILEWGDRISAWLLAEQDLRGYVPGRGWAHAIARGADALGALAGHPHCGASELAVLLDVLGDRATGWTDRTWSHGEADHLARATLRILCRDLVPVDIVEAWLDRIGEAGRPATGGRHRSGAGADADPTLAVTNTAAYLRALYLQLTLGPRLPADRADLLLLVVEQLRAAHPGFLTGG